MLKHKIFSYLVLLWIFRSLQDGGRCPVFPKKLGSSLWSGHLRLRGPNPRGCVVGNGISQFSACPLQQDTASSGASMIGGEMREAGSAFAALFSEYWWPADHCSSLSVSPPTPVISRSVCLSLGKNVSLVPVLRFADNVLLNLILTTPASSGAHC